MLGALLRHWQAWRDGIASHAMPSPMPLWQLTLLRYPFLPSSALPTSRPCGV